MSYNNNSNFKSEYVISEEVIATIATNAAKDVNGVAGFGNRPKDLYLAFKPGMTALRHCKVTVTDFDTKIHLYLILNANAKIQDVAQEVQKTVKKTIQGITGRLVTRVDITVTGIAKEPEEVPAKVNFDVSAP